MPLPPTICLYWQDDHCFETRARVVAVRDDALAFDRTCFYPGGGGQPADEGIVTLAGGQVFPISAAVWSPDEVIWHVLSTANAPDLVGEYAVLSINRDRRLALARYHTVLHVLNTIAARDYGAWITGVQIAVDYARIDFKWDGFSIALCPELAGKVNAVLDAARPLRSYYLPEEEFRRRPELRRTLQVMPPVVDGRVRVVEIEGFDVQACGGTHVESTAQVGRFSIDRTENKGKINKRLYVRLS